MGASDQILPLVTGIFTVLWNVGEVFAAYKQRRRKGDHRYEPVSVNEEGV